MGAWRRAKDAWCGPIWFVAEVDSRHLGHLEINIDDVRDVMKALHTHKWNQVSTAQQTERRLDEVTLHASDGREYSVNELDQVPLFAWRDAAIYGYTLGPGGSRQSMIGLYFRRNAPTGIQIDGLPTGAEQQRLFDVTVDALTTGARRRMCPRTRRFMALGALVILLVALWIWAWHASSLPLPTALLTGVFTATVGWLIVDRLSRPRRESWRDRCRVMLTTTSRELMDQRRHDTRRDWKVGVPTAVAAAVIGALLMRWLGM